MGRLHNLRSLTCRQGMGRFGLLLIGWCLFLQAWAQEAPLKPDVRLVIDVSGSMKRNDPNNLRQPAVDLLVRLVPDGSKAGVWTFGKYVNMIVPHQTVDGAWRDAASRKASEINSVGLFTNIGGALETAAHDAVKGNPGYATSVILLTDGMVDIAKDPAQNEAEWRRIVDDVFPQLKKAGYKVHAVALSDEADKNLLEKVALGTDGTFAVANSADDLMKIFLQAFDLAVPAQKVPLVNNRFVVDSSVNEFTALIFRKDSAEQTQLIGPDEVVLQAGKTPDDVRWLRTDEYDLITVSQPFEGEWQINAALEPQSRVTVVSNLALRVKPLPNNSFRGAKETLSFVLQEDGKTITDATFLGLLQPKVNMAYGPDDTTLQPHWEHVPPAGSASTKGVFTVALPELQNMGVYELRLNVDGKTFQRQFAHRFTVREPFTATIAQQLDEQGVAQPMLTVRSHSELIDPKQTQIAATVVNPVRRRFVKPLVLTEFDQWQTPVPMDVPGEYQITVQVTGTDKRQEPFDYALTPLRHTQGADSTFSEPAAEPVAAATEPPAQTEPSTPEPPPAEPPPAPAPEQLVVEAEPETTASEGLPSWLLYALLAVGNLAILGAGYWLFRKLMGGDNEEETPGTAETVAAAPPPPPPPAAVVAPEPQDDLMAMDTGEAEEEEPPMEDLDLDEPPKTAAAEEFDAEIPDLNDVVEEDDFTADDLEEELVQQVMGGESAESKEDFAAEIRRVQGLDLDQNELDDAISNLIDELDGEPPKGATGPDEFDDFDDFGMDDEGKNA